MGGRFLMSEVPLYRFKLREVTTTVLTTAGRMGLGDVLRGTQDLRLQGYLAHKKHPPP